MTKDQASNRYRLLNETEFSEITGIPVHSLRTMRARPERNGPPYIKQRKGVRYTLYQYEKWLEQNTVDSGDIRRAV